MNSINKIHRKSNATFVPGLFHFLFSIFTVLIDDEVAASVYESRYLNIDVTSITALTDKTFAEAETSPNLTLVLFYKPCKCKMKCLLSNGYR